MKLSRTAWTVIAVLILVVWLVLIWFLGDWLHLHSPALWVLRIGLWVIGIAGFIGYLLLRPKAEGAGEEATAGPEIDFAFNEASKRIRAARGIKQLGSMPAIFALGDTGSAKTSVIAKSGLEPELLAGHAYDNYVIAPTAALNLWYAHQSLLIDPAGAIVGDAGNRKKLFRKFLPVGLNSVVKGQLPASRSVVLTVDCDIFLQAGAAEALAVKARQFQSVFAELAQVLGSSFPVYVLFTKADRINDFREYVENMNDAEASDVLGVTLPMQGPAQGVYVEQQNRRITEAFQELYRWLCDKRAVYLGRENDPSKLPNVYEFPREFSKLRGLLTQFLVDLCRPSQLGTSPFLRGFYFTGVRPVTVTDLAPAAAQIATREEEPIDAGATRIFSQRMQGAPLAAMQPGQQVGSRKIPQWVFLNHLFSDVILADRPATAVTQANVKVNVARRILLASASALVLLLAIWWIVSFANNSSLVHRAVDDSKAAQADNPVAGQLASTESLQHLTNIKRTLVQLKDYDENGAPMSYRAFLYEGASMREPLRKIYYQTFRKLLLGPTQNNLVQICGRPEAIGNNDYVYDSLKSYLITTQYGNKTSTMPTLATVLLDRWQKGQAATKAQQDLALENFQFYASDLANGNPYTDTRPNENAVFTAREYLKNYNQEQHIYQMMLADAGRGAKTIIFNQDYPDSRGLIINGYPVDPAFSKAGSDNFMKELGDPKRYFNGEEWVLGPSSAPSKSADQLKKEFSALYSKDMIQRWQNYLNATAVAPYTSVPDAVTKLDKLGGGQSPLMRVLCLASDNTSKINDAKAVFQPLEVVTPPGCLDQPMGANASSYLASLIALKGALQQVASSNPPDPNAVNAATPVAIQAEGEVTKLSGTFRPDSPVFAKTTQLLKDPITRVDPLLKGEAGAPVNAGAGGVCAVMVPALAKYPFNPKSPSDATLDELNQMLNPQSGALWQFVNGPLKPYVTLAGNDYVANPAQQKPVVTPAYLRFLNQSKHLADALYKGGTGPSLSFTVQPLPAADLDHVTLGIDGTTLSTDPKAGTPKTFTWPGSPPSASLQVRYGGATNDFGIADKQGLWAVWRLLDTAQKVSLAGNQYQVQWAPETSAGPITVHGHPLVIPFSLDAQGSQIFSRGYFGDIRCLSKAVQ
jgi:type VI secretion system protein ImpL